MPAGLPLANEFEFPKSCQACAAPLEACTAVLYGARDRYGQMGPTLQDRDLSFTSLKQFFEGHMMPAGFKGVPNRL